MSRKFKFGFLLAALIALTACGDSLSGEYEGTTKLSRVYSGSDSSDTLKTGTGRISFPYPSTLRFGGNTSLPDCNLSFTERSENDYWVDTATQFKGETNDGNGCQALLASGPAIKADIYKGKMTRGKDGEVVVKIEFQPRDSTGSTFYELEFRGSKKGWF